MRDVGAADDRRWAGRHPGQFVARWRCGYPDKEEHDL